MARQSVQLDKYAKDHRAWCAFANHVYAASTALFVTGDMILVFSAATLGHHALEMYLKAALICEGKTVFDPKKIKLLHPSVGLTKRAVLAKSASQQYRPEQDLDNAIRQIVSRAVSSGEVLDIFQAAGLKKPDISILSDEFLAEVKHLPQKNLAVEMLRKLLTDEIKTRSSRNVVKSRLFSELLATSIRKYQNRAIQAAQVIEELIGLAKQMREESMKGEALGLSEDEVAFYDALEVNDSAVRVLGDETLKTIARELVDTVRRNTTIDWTVRENVRAHLRVLVKRILRKYGYPPDKQEKATATVLEQATVLSAHWAAA